MLCLLEGFRSFQRGTVCLFRSKSCRVMSCQIWRFEKILPLGQSLKSFECRALLAARKQICQKEEKQKLEEPTWKVLWSTKYISWVTEQPILKVSLIYGPFICTDASSFFPLPLHKHKHKNQYSNSIKRILFV